MYQKLKRTYRWGHLEHIPHFRETFPELNGVGSDELCQRFYKLGVEFFHEIETVVPLWLRFTLPFAILTMLLMLLLLPIRFLIYGNWGYEFSDNNFFLNWFRALGIK